MVKAAAFARHRSLSAPFFPFLCFFLRFSFHSEKNGSMLTDHRSSIVYESKQQKQTLHTFVYLFLSFSGYRVHAHVVRSAVIHR